jgi:hypothetical protein
MEKVNRYRMVRPVDEGIPKMRGLVQGIAEGLGLEFVEQPSPSSSLMF